jgi:hypothetical protein
MSKMKDLTFWICLLCGLLVSVNSTATLGSFTATPEEAQCICIDGHLVNATKRYKEHDTTNV